jgi:hypothetical protein
VKRSKRELTNQIKLKKTQYVKVSNITDVVVVVRIEFNDKI